MRLAEKLRPVNIDDIYGNKELIEIIKNMLKEKFIPSMILYGPAGCGKTSLAKIIAKSLDKAFYLNAAINKIKDFQGVIDTSSNYEKVVLVIDEIHRLNKDKQDILLPYIESGNLTIIGMTTNNPLYSINSALRSRCSIFEMKIAGINDVVKALSSDKLKEELPGLKMDSNVINYIATKSSGDLRYAYNTVETAYYAGNKKVSLEILNKIGTLPVISLNANSDEHYNLLSAFQKSIRGSHVDASLHYLSRLLAIGDLDSITRRMLVITYEDIGLANIKAFDVVNNAISAALKIGMPEAKIILGVAVIYLATSPKSNSGYLAINKAYNDVIKGIAPPIPDNISTIEDGYIYPHNVKERVVKQSYLPKEIEKVKYYEALNIGDEFNIKKIKEQLDKILN